MKKNKISKNWLIKKHRDQFFNQSKIQGYRSRSAFKLIEMNQKFRFINNKTHLLDLGITKDYWGYELGLNINNFLDEDYESPHGFNQNGRSLSFVFKKKF